MRVFKALATTGFYQPASQFNRKPVQQSTSRHQGRAATSLELSVGLSDQVVKLASARIGLDLRIPSLSGKFLKTTLEVGSPRSQTPSLLVPKLKFGNAIVPATVLPGGAAQQTRQPSTKPSFEDKRVSKLQFGHEGSSSIESAT